MKKQIIYIVAFLLAIPFSAHALSFSFYGSDAGGVGSATMDINISGTTLTATLENTSPAKNILSLMALLMLQELLVLGLIWTRAHRF